MSRRSWEARLLSALQSGHEAGSAAAPAGELPGIDERIAGALDQMDAERQAIARRLQWSLSEQSRLEERLARVENGLLFRTLRGIGNTARTAKLKTGHILLRTPLHSLFVRLTPGMNRNRVYENWTARQETRTPSWEWHRERALEWANRPLVSIVMATHNPRREWLREAVNSVRAQSYPFWELCVCDDASAPWIAEYLEGAAKEDSRVRCCASSDRLGISGAINRAGELARGQYVGFLDHDDVLSPLALHYVVESLQQDPADIVYTDEDYLDEAGRLIRPSFKPDWSPDLLTTCMYWGHFLVIARDRLEQIGWFRSECDGAQDYDVALRITDRPAVVRHVPRILYHWRQHPQSTAFSASAKRYTHGAGQRALRDACRRRQWDVDLEDGDIPNTYHVRRRLTETPRVSVIICSRNGRLLSRCLRALDPTRRLYPLQVVVVQHRTGEDDGVEKAVRAHRCETVVWRDLFDFAAMNNLGVAAAQGDVLLFLNDDVVPRRSDWLGQLLGHLQRPEIGIVGAKLVYRSGAIQHAGVVVGMPEGAGHPGRRTFQNDLWRWLNYTRDVSAVTAACMGIRRAVFAELGGFDTNFAVNYNDVDLCLRAREAGYRVIYEPRAVLRHHECQTRMPGTRLLERERFHDRWGELLLKPDPYFSSQLSRDDEEIRLA